MSTAARTTWSEAQRRAKRWYYAMTAQHPSGIIATRVMVPDDVVVLEEHTPCFNCGERGGCRHRPWMLA